MTSIAAADQTMSRLFVASREKKLGPGSMKAGVVGVGVAQSITRRAAPASAQAKFALSTRPGKVERTIAVSEANRKL